MRPLLYTVGLVLLAALTLRGETFDISWPTRHAAPPPALSAEQARWLPAFRRSLDWLPEPAVIVAALGQPGILGLPREAGERLTPLVAARYETILKDPEFATSPSHLAYCYAASRPATGLARVTTPAPDKIADAPVIVFLHGQGGSFLWYQHWLRTVFPDHVIISPAWGTGPAAISETYLRECVAAAEQKLNRKIPSPVLVGFSAGGFGVLHAAARDPRRYERTVVLAAFLPPSPISSTDWRGQRVRFVAGADEYFVTDGTLSHSVERLTRIGAQAFAETIPGSDHFFALTHPDETASALRRALADSSSTIP